MPIPFVPTRCQDVCWRKNLSVIALMARYSTVMFQQIQALIGQASQGPFISLDYDDNQKLREDGRQLGSNRAARKTPYLYIVKITECIRASRIVTFDSALDFVLWTWGRPKWWIADCR